MGWQPSRKLNTRSPCMMMTPPLRYRPVNGYTVTKVWDLRLPVGCFKLCHIMLACSKGTHFPPYQLISLNSFWQVTNKRAMCVILTSIIKHVIRSIDRVHRGVKNFFWWEVGTPNAFQSKLDSSKVMRWWDLNENGVTGTGPANLKDIVRIWSQIDRISTALNKSLRRKNLCIELLCFKIHLQYHHRHVLFPANLADIRHFMGAAATWRAMPLVSKILLLAWMWWTASQILSISTSKFELGPRPESQSYRVSRGGDPIYKPHKTCVIWNHLSR